MTRRARLLARIRKLRALAGDRAATPAEGAPCGRRWAGRLPTIQTPCIARYDGPEALFYIDPPYWGSEDDYGRGVWDRHDFAALAEQLRGIKGRFLLSINDVPEIRELFDWAEIEGVQTTYTIGGGGGHRAAELLIGK